MSSLLIALAIILISGCLALAACKNPRVSTFIGAGGTTAGCILGTITVLRILFCGSSDSLRRAWEIPYGSFALKIDPLSAFFLLPVFVLSALAAVYGSEYLRAYQGKKYLGIHWFFSSLLVASMAMVCLAYNTMLFLLAWEVMAVSSFFLVAFEYEKESVRKASWTYMVATYLGTACLLPMFLIFGKAAGSLDFDGFAHCLTPQRANICFILALIGFGTKAGIIPFHVWLPEAHPAAPSHVSALMSGIMIKTGIYGLVRILSFLGMPPMWWGWLLLAAGTVSGVLGVLFALAQHDLKRLLAYHSVENIGIITMGLGVGLIGWSAGVPSVAALGIAGGLFHVVNHALFKGLLFLGAGSVFHSTSTLEIDQLGGLLKKMPYTGCCFLVGAVAISGLPPLNGFVSEFLIYSASFRGALTMEPNSSMSLVCAIAGLALIGGLAAACFAKAFGIVFLGEPRSSEVTDCHESGFWMTIPMMILAAACIALGLMGPMIIRILGPVTGTVLGDAHAGEMPAASEYLVYVTTSAVALLVLLALLAGFRSFLLSGRTIGKTVTWDCAYAAPSARMQYTASSFAQPIIDLFRVFLRTKKHITFPDAYFPASANLETHTYDIGRERIYKPVFTGIERFFMQMRFLQGGRIQVYVLYIVVTLLILLAWNMG
jgi:hydrogenase-4 component B